jgi:valyl-tRNA synthetase
MAWSCCQYGVERFEARRMVAEQMELGFLIPHITKDKEGNEVEHDAEPRTIQTPFGDRGGVVIEPWLTDQWYVNAAVLAQKPIEAVKFGAIEIVPKSWEKTFFNWMENIQPWCVSASLVGHRIPAWYARGRQVFVAETEEEAQALAGNKALTRDSDVLDTWFSSALWPFATLGWPDEDAPLLKKHYPNDLLVSGFDILFFWDARMAMQGNALHEGSAVEEALSARPGARRRWRENVQVQGQCGRSAGPDRQIWRGRFALLHGGDGIAGPRCEDG